MAPWASASASKELDRMAQPIIAYGATVERSTDGVDYDRIPGCKGIAIPTVTQAYQRVTSLDSPNRFEEYVRAMRDTSEITVPMNFTAAGYQMMLEDEQSEDLIYYRTTLRDGSAFMFTGYPTISLDQTNDVADVVAMTLTIRPTGDITVEMAEEEEPPVGGEG
jgi:hypothetical protein